MAGMYAGKPSASPQVIGSCIWPLHSLQAVGVHQHTAAVATERQLGVLPAIGMLAWPSRMLTVHRDDAWRRRGERLQFDRQAPSSTT